MGVYPPMGWAEMRASIPHKFFSDFSKIFILPFLWLTRCHTQRLMLRAYINTLINRHITIGGTE